MRSGLGREIEAVGNNEQNAYLSGLSPKRAKIVAYSFSGLLSSAAGLFLVAQTGSGDAALGQVYTLNSIACVVLGGISLRGGKGSVFGPVLSAFLLSIIVSALLAWGISAFWQNLVQGSILVLVLVGAGLPCCVRAAGRVSCDGKCHDSNAHCFSGPDHALIAPRQNLARRVFDTAPGSDLRLGRANKS
jgi:ABC-type uncharacterized transport system permease subunit